MFPGLLDNWRIIFPKAKMSNIKEEFPNLGQREIVTEISKITGWNLQIDSIGDSIFSCIPGGYDRSQTFRINFQRSDVRVSAEIVLGSLAKNLMKALGKVSQENKDLFFHSIDLIEEKSIQVRLHCGSYQGPAKDMSPWPNSWKDFRLILTRTYSEKENVSNLLIDIGDYAISLMSTVLPLERIEAQGYEEGALIEFMHKRYERNKKNREIAIKIHGNICKICNFSTKEVFGKDEIIQVHHILPVSEMNEGHVVDPEKELIPVCPTCHAFIHTKKPPYSIDEVISMRKSGS